MRKALILLSVLHGFVGIVWIWATGFGWEIPSNWHVEALIVGILLGMSLPAMLATYPEKFPDEK